MSVRIFICLVFIAEIVASDYLTTSEYGDSTKYSVDNQRNTRILVTDTLNDSPVGTAQSINITENKTNVTGSNITVIPITTEQDKNGTVTKKPEADKEGMEAQSSQIVNSYPPYSSYEVTENVIDVPDDRTPGGPIVPTYTHNPPILNLARPNNKTTEANNIKSKKNHLSIFHLNADFDDKYQEAEENKIVGLFKGIKNYIHSFQKGIVKGFHDLFHKHHHDDEHHHDHDHDHGDRLGRDVDDEEGDGESDDVLEKAIDNEDVESDEVQDEDKTEYNVHRRRRNVLM
ncbi:hypothetical protein PYW07_008212 [Mythimna separata]|uniref:Uncharacterized protein n=1 Tax=Mythimna separata TaxID=271217 RepID=A0AAD8DMM6_MYTSE|nr:hypothetical protein PYW07_008212 [Mythimna separata]